MVYYVIGPVAAFVIMGVLLYLYTTRESRYNNSVNRLMVPNKKKQHAVVRVLKKYTQKEASLGGKDKHDNYQFSSFVTGSKTEYSANDIVKKEIYYIDVSGDIEETFAITEDQYHSVKEERDYDIVYYKTILFDVTEHKNE